MKGKLGKRRYAPGLKPHHPPGPWGFCYLLVKYTLLGGAILLLLGSVNGGLNINMGGSQVKSDDNDYPTYQVEIDLLGENEDHSGLFNPSEEMELHMKEKETAKVTQELLNDGGEEALEEESQERGAVAVEELGGLLFEDGQAYMQAEAFPDKEVLPRQSYQKMWYLQELMDGFMHENPHRRYIPRLAQPITKLQFHETFRQTSTPVIIPFEMLRNLGVVTKGWTLEELRKRFPYEPPKNGKLPLAYNHKSGYKDGLDFGPALYALEQDVELAKGGGSQRNFPRNLMIKSKYLQMLEVSRPPFIPRRRFQPPTLWMGTTTADTRLHMDCCDNFVQMIAGTKRWFICPPQDARELSPIRCDGIHHSLCWASVKYPNANPLPAKDQAKLDQTSCFTIDLHAGEMLYLPAGWWHHIENLGPTVMVNMWTMGCENVAVALDKDPTRADRPDLKMCPAIAQKTAAFLLK